MVKILVAKALLPLFALLSLVSSQQGNYTASDHVWLDTPGTDFKSGLALGNGRLGALLLGSAKERVILNENSVWSGGFQDRINPQALNAVPAVRQLLVDKKYTEAAARTLRDVTANPTTSRWYSVTGDLNLDFGHNQSSWTNYERWLDVREGVAGVRYDLQGVTYTREIIANFPETLLAMRLTASKAGALNVDISLTRNRGILSNVATASTGRIALDVGGTSADAIPFSTGVQVVNSGGTISNANPSTLRVTRATTVDLFIDVETSFQWETEALWKRGLAQKLDTGKRRGYTSLKSEAVSDHKSLMDRVRLDLGSSGNAGLLTTSARRDAYAQTPAADPEFITVNFNFGRHLLISSSRDTGGPGLGVPANLQGIWNDMYNPPWGSKFTININTQMNYWLAELTDLPETLRPLWDLLKRSHDKGIDTAKRMYGCPGYVTHHNLDLWGDGAPHDNGTAYSVWPSSSLWLSQHLLEHYRFTGNRAFLQNIAWPLLKDLAAFLDCYLFEVDGYLTAGPSTSPENQFYIPADGTTAGSREAIDISTTMDNSLIRQFSADLTEAASVLGVDTQSDAVLSKATKLGSAVRPSQIGSFGQIKEWRFDYQETTVGHTHLSPLVDLYPGRSMTPLVNSSLATAAGVSLDRRLGASGGAQNGWARTWAAAGYARLLDGTKAWNNIRILLQRHPLGNLFHEITRGSAFQADSNYGIVAAVAETLLQSQAGVVHLLPALKGGQIRAGSVRGLVARGGFVVDLSWKDDGSLKVATIRSRRGGRLKLRVADGASFKINGAIASEVDTTAGGTYTVSL